MKRHPWNRVLALLADWAMISDPSLVVVSYTELVACPQGTHIWVAIVINHVGLLRVANSGSA